MAQSVRAFPQSTAALAALRSRLPLQSAADLDSRLDLLPTGNFALDAALGGGLARRRTHLLTGTRGSGAASLLHLLLAAVTPTAPVFLLDPHHRFFPPAALAAGAYLPHLLLVRETDGRVVERAVAAAVRAGAFPLVVWDAGTLPPMPLLNRYRPLVRAGGCAFLLVTGEHAPAHTPADGASLAVSHARWEYPFGGAECGGRTVSVSVTNHLRQRTTTLPLTLIFPQPLPPFLHRMGKGGAYAGASRGGTLGAGVTATSGRTG